MIEVVRGPELGRRIKEVARLRLSVFREYPYLYDGTLEYEATYLASYSRCAEAVVVLARDGERIVGASTALPLAAADPEFQAPFIKAGIPVEPIFYLGESVLLPAYRGRGLGARFFDEREAAAGSNYQTTAFCAVVRPGASPDGYRPLDDFWRRRGYSPRPDLLASFSWRDVGDRAETAKPMLFWLRGLE